MMMAERVLLPTKQEEKKIRIHQCTGLPWPRIRKVMSLDNQIVGEGVELRDHDFYLKGTIRQEITYLDWRGIVRVFEALIPINYRLEKGRSIEGKSICFRLCKHIYRLQQSRQFWLRSYLDQELVLEFDFGEQPGLPKISPASGLEKINVLLICPVSQRGNDFLKRDTVSLSTPAREITLISLKVNLLKQEVVEEIVSCLLQITIELYYLGLDGKEHYEEAKRETAVQIVLNSYSAPVEVEVKPDIELIDYRLSRSGYGLVVNYLLTTEVFVFTRERQNILVLKDNRRADLDCSTISAFIDLVGEEREGENVLDNRFVLPGWVAEVTKLTGKAEIIHHNFNQGTAVFKGLAKFDFYCADKMGRQYLIQETKEFNLLLQFGEDNSLEQRVEQECNLTVLNHSFHREQGVLSCTSLVSLQAVTVRARLCNLITDISSPDLNLNKKSFALWEVVCSDSCQVSFNSRIGLINPAKRILDCRVIVSQLLKEIKGNNLLISGLLEQEISYVSLDNVIHIQKDVLSFNHQLGSECPGSDVQLNAGEVIVLPRLLQDGSKVEGDYLLTVEVWGILRRVYSLPVSWGVKNQSLINLNCFEETICLSIPVSLKPEQLDKVNASLKQVGLSRQTDQFYLTGRLVLGEEEIGFYYPLSGQWGKYSSFISTIETIGLTSDKTEKPMVNVVLKLCSSGE